MNRTCVKCTSVLDRGAYGGVEVDTCPACGGVWLDHGEIERLGKTGGDLEKLRTALSGGEQAGLSDAIASCPACPGQLREVKLGPVHIDYCTKCKGVFLDRGELDQALAQVKGSTIEQVLRLAGQLAG